MDLVLVMGGALDGGATGGLRDDRGFDGFVGWPTSDVKKKNILASSSQISSSGWKDVTISDSCYK